MASSAAKADARRGALTGTRAPRELAFEGAAPPVLALHGFGGTPYEVELVVEVAQSLGLQTLAPLLPGHGTHARELARTEYADWLAGAEAAFDRLSSPAIVTGLSLGTLLALELALRHPERVLGLVLMSNALWLRAPFPRYALDLCARLRVPDVLVPKAGPNIGDPEARARHVSYDAHPLHAAIAVQNAGRALVPRLTGVHCPTLFLHGRRDALCPVSNAWRAATLLGTRDTRIVLLQRSAHILTTDVERDVAAREIGEFLGRFVGDRAGSGRIPVALA